MMNKHKLCLVIWGLSFLTVYGQNMPSQMLHVYADNIQLFSNIYPQEKVDLHFDNTDYFPEDFSQADSKTTVKMQRKSYANTNG
jgi:hypothetical protein